MAKKKNEAAPKTDAAKIKEKLDVIQEATQPDLTKEGTVKDCGALNVRLAPRPNAPVAEVIKLGDKVKVDTAVSVKDFYKVTTASGIDGFCMKKFIKVSK